MKVNIILAHGSKREDTKLIMNELVKKVVDKTGWNEVYPAYLQLCEPSLEQVMDSIVNKGVTEVVIMPMFLFNGEHVTKDIPEMIKELEAKYPGIAFHLKGFIGPDDRIADIIIDRINS